MRFEVCKEGDIVTNSRQTINKSYSHVFSFFKKFLLLFDNLFLL
jgi:hypothetical protein